MKKKVTLYRITYMLAIAMFLITSCKKESTQTDTQLTGTATQSTTGTQAVSVAEATGSNDSVYAVNVCSRGSRLDSVAFSDLPSSVSSYLADNYNGYTFQKALKVDSAGTTAGYVVVIQYNGKPVGLKFDAAGTFIKVLEQREGHDFDRPGGWHRGGQFDDRGGMKKDTIALSELPASIQSYFSTNYPTDTLVKAYKDRDSSIVLLSINNGAFATVFSASGTFIKRVQLQLPAHHYSPVPIAQNDLPTAIQSYLSSTYPNYTFKDAFVVQQNGTIQGYVVFFDANNTKYAVAFDAAGNFIKAVTVR